MITGMSRDEAMYESDSGCAFISEYEVLVLVIYDITNDKKT